MNRKVAEATRSQKSHLKEYGHPTQCHWEPLKSLKQESSVLTEEVTMISRMVVRWVCEHGGDTRGGKTNQESTRFTRREMMRARVAG